MEVEDVMSEDDDDDIRVIDLICGNEDNDVEIGFKHESKVQHGQVKIL